MLSPWVVLRATPGFQSKNSETSFDQGTDLRRIRHGGRLARVDHPRGRAARPEEEARGRLGEVRRRLARGLPPGDGPRAQGRARLDQYRCLASDDPGRFVEAVSAFVSCRR